MLSRSFEMQGIGDPRHAVRPNRVHARKARTRSRCDLAAKGRMLVRCGRRSFEGWAPRRLGSKHRDRIGCESSELEVAKPAGALEFRAIGHRLHPIPPSS